MTATKVETFKEWLKEFKENNKKRKWNHKYYWDEGKKIFLASFIVFSLASCKKDNNTETITVNEQHAHTCTIKMTWVTSGTVNVITEGKYLRESDVVSYENANTHSDNDLIQTCDCVDQ